MTQEQTADAIKRFDSEGWPVVVLRLIEAGVSLEKAIEWEEEASK